MTRYTLFSILILSVSFAKAQSRISFDTNKVNIPMTRVIWHENIDKEQKRTDKVDGKVDQFLKLSNNDD
ncbi:MAG: hypothetical protein ABL872_07065, partial [Lacibacter sp.]